MFGKYIRQLRNDKKIGLRKAAEALNISPSYLCKLEGGQDAPPSIQIIERMASYYQVSPDKLIFRASKRRFLEQDIEKYPHTAEIFALYRAAQELDPNTLFELLVQVYEAQGKSREQALEDIQKLDNELPRLPKGKDGLLACKIVPRFLSRRRIESMADDVLAAWGRGPGNYLPPTQIEEIVEGSSGITLTLTSEWDGQDDECEPFVLGLSRWSSPEQREIVISAKLFESPDPRRRARMNFTLAHEYFHAIEHLPLISARRGETLNRMGALPPQISERGSAVRPSIREMRLKHWVKKGAARTLSTDEDWREWQANFFAAALLMPSWALEREFKARFGVEHLTPPAAMNEREYALEVGTTQFSSDFVFDQSLSALFAVSAQAMAIRLLQTGLVKANAT